MLSLRAHIIICVSLFAALVMLVPAAGALQALGFIKDPTAYKIPVMVLLVGLFLAFGFSAVPVMVKLVLGSQRRIGNQDVPAIRSALARETLIIWVMWALMAGGMLIALPAAIADGAFGSEPRRAFDDMLSGKSEGVLAAKPGMTVEEMVRGSTLKLEVLPNAPVVAGGKMFEFHIPGSSLVFPDCRYYYVSTFTHDSSHIQGISIGTSRNKLTRAERDRADADLRVRLASDGWLTGHEVYRGEEDRQLHGGLTRGPEGRIWLKDGTLLTIEGSRVDEPAAGEDPDAALIWIQAISLWSADDYSGFDRLVFAPPESG
jgi:hypothetical protein